MPGQALTGSSWRAMPSLTQTGAQRSHVRIKRSLRVLFLRRAAEGCSVDSPCKRAQVAVGEHVPDTTQPRNICACGCETEVQPTGSTQGAPRQGSSSVDKTSPGTLMPAPHALASAPECKREKLIMGGCGQFITSPSGGDDILIRDTGRPLLNKCAGGNAENECMHACRHGVQASCYMKCFGSKADHEGQTLK